MFSFAEALDATFWAKSMTNLMCIESVFGHHVITRNEVHSGRWHEWKKKSLSLTMRAVALKDRMREIQLDWVSYSATMAASAIVRHRRGI
jgi:hypothetical protein